MENRNVVSYCIGLPLRNETRSAEPDGPQEQKKTGYVTVNVGLRGWVVPPPPTETHLVQSRCCILISVGNLHLL